MSDQDRALAKYVDFWRVMEPGPRESWIHPRDGEIEGFQPAVSSAKCSNWQDYTNSSYFDAGEPTGAWVQRKGKWVFAEPTAKKSKDQGVTDPRTRIHSYLVPQPHVGCLATAKLVICNLNPGFGHHYMGSKEFDSALERNLFQRPGPGFFFLDKGFAWSAGYQWWRRKWKKLWNPLEIHKSENRAWLVNHVAAVELFPYNSTAFAFDRFTALPSVRAAQELFRDFLLPRAKSGSVALAVMRKWKEWPIDDTAKCLMGMPEMPGPNTFILGENHARAGVPLDTWLSPTGQLYRRLADSMRDDGLIVGTSR